MSIHLIWSLCAFRIARFFLRPPRTRLFGIADPCRECASRRCADSGDNRGSGSTSSNIDGIAGSLRLRMYLAGEISARTTRPPPHVVSSFITYANLYL